LIVCGVVLAVAVLLMGWAGCCAVWAMYTAFGFEWALFVYGLMVAGLVLWRVVAAVRSGRRLDASALPAPVARLVRESGWGGSGAPASAGGPVGVFGRASASPDDEPRP
jgi:hypothetical protein